MSMSKKLLVVSCAATFTILSGCAADTSDGADPGDGEIKTGTVSSASASGCNAYALSKDYMGSVCTDVSGSGLHTSSISGSYSGNYACTSLDLYINGSHVESSPFCHSYYPHTFATGRNHHWPGTTSVKVCARFINFVGQFCGPTFHIHA